MSKIEEAQVILQELGLPNAQHNEISGYTLLALCNVKERDKWSGAYKQSHGVSKGIMAFISENYKKNYAPNTRETFRRQVLHQFVQAGIADYNPDIPDLPVNSPHAHYAISEIVLETIKTFGTNKWKQSVKYFKEQIGELIEKYSKDREMSRVPVKLANGEVLNLSPGKHNKVQAAIVEEFASRFAQGSVLLYLGDTENKDLYVNTEKLETLGIKITEHSKLPDVVIFDESKNWLYLIEAVTSHGPMSPKRIVELEGFLSDCKAGKIYISAFPDFSEFKKHTNNIAWETEVWVMEFPEHMIHFNGDRFFGPR
ncbi:MAG: restriction endonuclease [Prolixibacteraceae bacterium]|jgi:type II restriction enzyme|nr:restriction endonuclease [Prolixibacteraceae bacterium]MBT6004582.1 restriction endonuclease [Prolixibacteraceae bacterium]MBT6763358.1 restriction endonuclease [Prolixibacteraceae bacterium]MBT6997024.1 restriction endonuclease [Prolixibacteraceae bacterium]MBT7396922.1 restriction endonuclease [Prolixibacteraceae bacterium]